MRTRVRLPASPLFSTLLPRRMLSGGVFYLSPAVSQPDTRLKCAKCPGSGSIAMTEGQRARTDCRESHEGRSHRSGVAGSTGSETAGPMPHDSISVAGRDFLPIDALFDVNRTRAVPPAFLSFRCRFIFRAFRGAASRTDLSRRGGLRESMSERGHRRCPSEFRFAAPTRGRAVSHSACSPAAFFRPLFGRSKRGHSDGADRQDDYTEEGTRTVRSSNHIGGEGCLPAQRSPTECRRRRPCRGPAIGGGQCDWPHRRQGERPVNPRLALTHNLEHSAGTSSRGQSVPIDQEPVPCRSVRFLCPRRGAGARRRPVPSCGGVGLLTPPTTPPTSTRRCRPGTTGRQWRDRRSATSFASS